MQTQTNEYLQSAEWFRLIMNELEAVNSREETLKLKQELSRNPALGVAIDIVRQNRRAIGREWLRHQYVNEAVHPKLEPTDAGGRPGRILSTVFTSLRQIRQNRVWQAAALVVLLGIGLLIKIQYTALRTSREWVAVAKNDHRLVQAYIEGHLDLPTEVTFPQKGTSGKGDPLQQTLLILGKESFTTQEIDREMARVTSDSMRLADLYRGMGYLFATNQNLGLAISSLHAAQQSPSSGVVWLATYYLGNAYLANKEYEQGMQYLKEVASGHQVQKGLRLKAVDQVQYMEKLRENQQNIPKK